MPEESNDSLRGMLERLMYLKDFNMVPPIRDFLDMFPVGSMERRKFSSFHYAIGVLRRDIHNTLQQRTEQQRQPLIHNEVKFIRLWDKFVDRVEEIFWDDLHDWADTLFVLNILHPDEAIKRIEKEKKEG